MDQPFHPALKTHGLTGKLRGLRAIRAGYDLRVVYKDEGALSQRQSSAVLKQTANRLEL
jgi:mRNA-degrading endonuclease YafQ of YafQ-DinJ toxin-antitoxin module